MSARKKHPTSPPGKPAFIQELERIEQEERSKQEAEAKAAAKKEERERVTALEHAAEYGRTALYDELKVNMIRAAKSLKREASVNVGTDSDIQCMDKTREALLTRLEKEHIQAETFHEKHESWHDPDCGRMGWDGISYHIRIKW